MSHHVLLVDDSATTRAFLKRALALSGLPIAAVHEAPHGAAALELLAKQHIDMVFTDLHMPVMDGHALMRAMAQSPTLCRVPVVIVSADPNAPSATAGGGPDCDGCHLLGQLRKPFTPENVRDLLAATLEVTRADAA